MANATENVPCIRIAPVLPILSTTHHTEANPGPHLLDEPKPFAGNHGDPGFPLTSSSVATRSIIRHEDACQQPEHAAVNTKMTNAPWRSPEVSTAVPIPMQERRGYTVVSKTYDGHLTPCSPQAEPLAPSASGSPASPNNDLISRKDQLAMKQSVYNRKYYKTEAGTPHHRLDVMGEGRETNATRLLGVEDELLIEAKDLELTQRVPEDVKPPNVTDAQFQRPDQEVVGNVGLSMILCSPRPAAAFTQHAPTCTPVKTLPAHSHPRSRLELEFRLRWKPPDTGQRSIQLAYYAIKNR